MRLPFDKDWELLLDSPSFFFILGDRILIVKMIHPDVIQLMPQGLLLPFLREAAVYINIKSVVGVGDCHRPERLDHNSFSSRQNS